MSNKLEKFYKDMPTNLLIQGNKVLRLTSNQTTNKVDENLSLHNFYEHFLCNRVIFEKIWAKLKNKCEENKYRIKKRRIFGLRRKNKQTMNPSME